MGESTETSDQSTTWLVFILLLLLLGLLFLGVLRSASPPAPSAVAVSTPTPEITAAPAVTPEPKPEPEPSAAATTTAGTPAPIEAPEPSPPQKKTRKARLPKSSYPKHQPTAVADAGYSAARRAMSQTTRTAPPVSSGKAELAVDFKRGNATDRKTGFDQDTVTYEIRIARIRNLSDEPAYIQEFHLENSKGQRLSTYGSLDQRGLEPGQSREYESAAVQFLDVPRDFGPAQLVVEWSGGEYRCPWSRFSFTRNSFSR